MSALLAAGDPRLARREDLGAVRELLLAFEPRDEHQAGERARMLVFAAEHPDALLRTCLAGHFTASGLVLDARGEHALLTHHRKLGRWLQLGGHADGDGNLAAVALREATEESGIAGLRVDPRPVDLDVHAIPARGAEPEHLHLDLRFQVHAPPGAREVASDESHALAWFAPGGLSGLELDDSVLRLFRLAFGAGRAGAR